MLNCVALRAVAPLKGAVFATRQRDAATPHAASGTPGGTSSAAGGTPGGTSSAAGGTPSLHCVTLPPKDGGPNNKAMSMNAHVEVFYPSWIPH